jgi:hypothetical protein
MCRAGADMRWLHGIYIAAILCACAQPVLGEDWAPTWQIAGDLALDSKSKSAMDACIARTDKLVTELPPHRLHVGAYIDSAGRPVNVAVLESSGLPDLDHATIECIRHGRFKVNARQSETVYWVFSEFWSPKPAPTVCDDSIKPVGTVVVKLSPTEPDYGQYPATGDSVVCMCRPEGQQEPSAPIIVSSSGNARLDNGAILFLKKSAQTHKANVVGCTGYRFHFEK